MASGIQRLKMNRRAKRLGRKIKKIMHEGIRGKKVRMKQAVAVAYAMMRKHR